MRRAGAPLTALSSVATEPGPSRGVAITRLALTDFRGFARAVIDCDARPVVLTGPNGAGKTNIIEALSLLAPGSGLRSARLGDLRRRDAPEDARWAVAARLDGPAGPVSVGTGEGETAAGDARRIVRIDGKPARGQAGLAELLGVVWLTPAQDRLFLDGASARRRFFDRLVYGFDPGHARRIAAYERALRERSRLLRDGSGDDAWLGALEGAMAEHGVAVAAARRDTLRMLARTLVEGDGTVGGDAFPAADLALDGAVEGWLDEMPAVEAEARLVRALRDSRRIDAEAGGARVGPHRSDLLVDHRAKAMPAGQCSTGEQKALVIAIVLAAARCRVERLGAAPVLLLDEVAAHLDRPHREALFDAIEATGAQAWLTGTDRATFAALGGRARHIGVRAGRVLAEAGGDDGHAR